MIWLLRVVVVLLGAGMAWPARIGQAKPPATPYQLTIAAPSSTSFFGVTPQFSISPDGKTVVFVANGAGRSPSLWIRALDSGAVRELSGTDQASYPFWSPDGRFVGFFASGKLKTLAVAGGPPTVVCDAPTGRGGTWNSSGIIVFASGINDPLRKVASAGGTPSPLTAVDGPRENSHRWPQFLPDGRHVLFWAGAGTGPAQLKVASLDSSNAATIRPADANAAYASGHLFFKIGSALMAQPFDASALETTGEPAPVVSPISNDAGSAFASFAVSPGGTIVYTRGTARPLVLTWFDRGGKTVGTLGEPGQYTNATLGPEGKRLAVSLTAGTPANRDIWIVDVASGGATRITTDPAVDATPIWSPDGTRIVFSSQRAGPYQMYARTLAGGVEELLLKSPTATVATDWSRDERFVAFTRTDSKTGLDVWVLPLFGDRQPSAFAETAASEDNAAFSPDGRWIAYQSNESGRDEVYVGPFPPAGGKRSVLVSAGGGTQPRWRGDGNELFFLAPDGSVMAAAVHVGPMFAVDRPTRLLPASMTLVIRHAYTTTADGQRILMPVLDERNPPVLTVVPDWRK